MALLSICNEILLHENLPAPQKYKSKNFLLQKNCRARDSKLGSSRRMKGCFEYIYGSSVLNPLCGAGF